MTKEGPHTSTPSHRSPSRVWGVLLVLGIVLLAANLRPVLTGLTPLIGQIKADMGISYGGAGLLMALSAQVVDIASIFLAPVLAGRRPSQYGAVVAAVTLTGAGALVLLVVADTATALWVVLLGLGQGACFSLALTFFALRAPDSEHAAAHSGMAQPIGYLLAAVGPFLFGVLRDATQA
jgi:CP family cyanate transporter-like MFS transporter